MDERRIENQLAEDGYVSVDLDSGVHVLARGPARTDSPPGDEQEETIVMARTDTVVLDRIKASSRKAGAAASVRLVRKHGGS